MNKRLKAKQTDLGSPSIKQSKKKNFRRKANDSAAKMFSTVSNFPNINEEDGKLPSLRTTMQSEVEEDIFSPKNIKSPIQDILKNRAQRSVEGKKTQPIPKVKTLNSRIADWRKEPDQEELAQRKLVIQRLPSEKQKHQIVSGHLQEILQRSSPRKTQVRKNYNASLLHNDSLAESSIQFQDQQNSALELKSMHISLGNEQLQSLDESFVKQDYGRGNKGMTIQELSEESEDQEGINKGDFVQLRIDSQMNKSSINFSKIHLERNDSHSITQQPGGIQKFNTGFIKHKDNIRSPQRLAPLSNSHQMSGLTIISKKRFSRASSGMHGSSGSYSSCDEHDASYLPKVKAKKGKQAADILQACTSEFFNQQSLSKHGRVANMLLHVTDEKIFKKDRYNRKKGVEEEDDLTLLQQNAYDIKNAMYKLQAIAGTSTQHEIKNGDQTKIDIVKGIPYSCKIPLTDQKPPLTLSIKFVDDSDVTIIGSFTEKEPSRKKHDLYKHGRQTKFKIEPKVPSEETFGKNHTFNIIISTEQARASLIMKPSFQVNLREMNEEDNEARKKQLAIEAKQNAEMFNQVAEESKASFLQQARKGHRIEYQNIENIQTFQADQYRKRILKAYQHHQKIEYLEVKKVLAEQQRIEKIVVKSNKWKEFRIAKDKAIRLYVKAKNRAYLATKINIHLMFRKFAKSAKFEIKKRRAAATILRNTKKWLAHSLKKFHIKKITDRHLSYARDSFRFYGIIQCDTAYDQALDTLKPYVKCLLWRIHMKACIVRMFKLIIGLQRKMYDLRVLRRARMKYAKWDFYREFKAFKVDLEAQKKNPAAQAIAKNMVKFNWHMADMFLQRFHSRCIKIHARKIIRYQVGRTERGGPIRPYFKNMPFKEVEDLYKGCSEQIERELYRLRVWTKQKELVVHTSKDVKMDKLLKVESMIKREQVAQAFEAGESEKEGNDDFFQEQFKSVTMSEVELEQYQKQLNLTHKIEKFGDYYMLNPTKGLEDGDYKTTKLSEVNRRLGKLREEELTWPLDLEDAKKHPVDWPGKTVFLPGEKFTRDIIKALLKQLKQPEICVNKKQMMICFGF